MFVLFYTVKMVYICVFKIVPHPIVFVTHLWIHVVYVWTYLCVYLRVYVFMCMWEHSINKDPTEIGSVVVG